MNLRIFPALVAATLLAAACGSTTPPPPASAPPAHEDRFLINPRIGYTQTSPPSVEKRFESAWRVFLAGNLVSARQRMTDLRTRNPQYLPAALGEAAIDLKQGNLDAARAIVQSVESQAPDYLAAQVYDAEIAIAEHRTRAAYDLYRALAQRPGAPPSAAERVTMLQNRLFAELYSSAQTAPDDVSIALLQDAVTINPGSLSARVMLANKFIARRSFEEARKILEPVVHSADAGKEEVQQALAEIEVGRGQYQQAIARYDRLSHLDPRYLPRLDQIKQEWNAANMPPQYQNAFESDAIDRSDFAVLAYWKLPSIRFAQNLSSPPIAIDIEGIPGREEIIRMIAVGVYDVDPVTRRVSPLRPVNAAVLERLGARLLSLGGATCARSIPRESVLTACKVNDPALTLPPDAPITGKMAAAMLDDIDKALPH